MRDLTAILKVGLPGRLLFDLTIKIKSSVFTRLLVAKWRKSLFILYLRAIVILNGLEALEGRIMVKFDREVLFKIFDLGGKDSTFHLL